ncbi:MAG TPA: hypothetical protein VKU00_28295 [Chthonomonadaceae bacterium]|nr:hypothetical protein [Chthonomonadaceae bacterium]
MKTTPSKYFLLQAGMLMGITGACIFAASLELHAQDRLPSETRTTANVSRPAAGTIYRPVVHIETTVTLEKRKYDLAKQEDLQAFLQEVKDLRALAKTEKDEVKADKKAEKKEQKADKKQDQQGEKAGKQAEKAEKEEQKSDATEEATEGTPREAKHKGGEDWSSKKVRNGLKALEQIAGNLAQGKGDSAAEIHDIQEITWAVESNFRTPYVWRSSVDLGDVLFRTRYLTLNACGRGSAKDPAINLSTYEAADLSKVDPLPSTYWSPPESNRGRDLYIGFDRAALPDFSTTICTFKSPHKGYGIHPSFEVMRDDVRWKVKFDEEHSSGPFASRIFWAMGYPVEVYDYAPEVKVQWDRRILTQFNARQLNSTEIRLAHIPLFKEHPNRYFDPFHYIQYAVLKDGSRIEAEALRTQLFPVAPGHSRPKQPEKNPSLYNTAFESKLDYVVLKDASVTTNEDEEGDDIGFWDYNNLNHDGLREVRAMAVLDAWMDNWDVRWSNNRLYLVEEKKGSYRLKHVVTDLGALFGNSSGLIRFVHGKLKSSLYQNVPNDYEWTFTHPQAPGKMTVPICNYMPVSKIEPFYELNLDDARWIARRMAQLSEDQIKTALIAAGYEAPVARLLLEKLVSRRDHMIQDFGLSNEIPPLRPHGVDTHVSYNPATDGPFEVTLPSGEKLTARNTGDWVLINGDLKPTRTHKAG